MAQPEVPWYPPIAYPAAAKPSVLPVVEREYHEFYRAPAFRWWKPLVAIAMFAGTWFLASFALTIPALAYDLNQGNLVWSELAAGELKVTPVLFLANNLTIVAAIPLAWAAHRVVFGQRVRWLSSVEGRFRWRAFWRFTGVIAPLYLLSLVVETVAGGGLDGLAILPETWFLLASILLTTPLQCAGEEISLRGLGSRAIGSWFPSRRAGLVVATAVTAVVFMLLHGAGDPWLNGFYLVFAVCSSYLLWKTGGLEGSIALHVVNNLTSMVFLPFVGVDGIFDREAGVGNPWVLLQMAVILAAGALILWQARRLGLSTSAAPAAPRGPANDSSLPAPGPAGSPRGV
ncbi:MAG: CPBP family intramembrane glutamic endopeptidase [Propionicimonas sp.]|uniref:CPBP family intramembrane glutamic endopeptidase n=1 Tax=Propionicimonas sp. TaxID=1955623 RepID=UPI002B1F4B1F|nr:CPBP family intramembrane glutamic endopeptidase [Propionicimonas sp.]MEA4943724.1 CPBP family intramembrane glutamic endopeptidase [Propionicimonas sp.]MEA5054598.1 CPBP family intramembrane glutamic endopeptidase [Propionicimonas sp.]MEA5119310.1 CPBP family intramembrane glutamic endopeptidase [Propionicimonas sp.]